MRTARSVNSVELGSYRAQSRAHTVNIERMKEQTQLSLDCQTQPKYGTKTMVLPKGGRVGPIDADSGNRSSAAPIGGACARCRSASFRWGTFVFCLRVGAAGWRVRWRARSRASRYCAANPGMRFRSMVCDCLSNMDPHLNPRIPAQPRRMYCPAIAICSLPILLTGIASNSSNHDVVLFFQCFE